MKIFDNNANSTHLIAEIGYLAFLAVSIFLCVTGREFAYYAEFSALTAGSGTMAAIAGRYVDSKYNSHPGKMPK